MTTMPVEPTLPQTISLSSVDELRAQAQRLGLTWDLRAATIAEVSGAFSAYVPRIDLDGDDADSAGITAVSFIGGVAIGMRVMIMFVPPVGAYIIGAFNPTQIQRFEIGSHTSHGTTITSTETVMETFDDISVLPGAAYRIEIDGTLIAAAGTFTRFRIRKTNTAGQLLDGSAWTNGQGIAPISMRHVGYIRNNGTEAIISDIALTAATLGSTATWYADAEIARFVSLQYAGPAIEYPSAIGIT